MGSGRPATTQRRGWRPGTDRGPAWSAPASTRISRGRKKRGVRTCRRVQLTLRSRRPLARPRRRRSRAPFRNARRMGERWAKAAAYPNAKGRLRATLCEVVAAFLAAFQDLAIRAGEQAEPARGLFRARPVAQMHPNQGEDLIAPNGAGAEVAGGDPRKRFARATLLAGGRPGVLTRIQTSRPVPHPPGCRCTWSAFRAASAMPDSPELCSGLPSDRLPARLGDPQPGHLDTPAAGRSRRYGARRKFTLSSLFGQRRDPRKRLKQLQWSRSRPRLRQGRPDPRQVRTDQRPRSRTRSDRVQCRTVCAKLNTKGAEPRGETQDFRTPCTQRFGRASARRRAETRRPVGREEWCPLGQFAPVDVKAMCTKRPHHRLRSSGALIVGDHSMSRRKTSCPYQRSITAAGSEREACSAASLAAPVSISRSRVRAHLARMRTEQ
jgi:hypothetical protein